jgi:hypothetical protein
MIGGLLHTTEKEQTDKAMFCLRYAPRQHLHWPHRMVQSEARILDALAAPAPAPCSPKLAPSVAVQDCSPTRVRGLLGTG